MNSFSISSLTEDALWEIEDNLSGAGDKVTSGGGGKNEHKGPKTSREIRNLHKYNANKNRVAQAEIDLKKDLEHFPFQDFSEEKLSDVLTKYSTWVFKSIDDNYPFFTNLDEDIDYSQSRSSGPGGQNVNKTSTAVTALHLLTGIYARSEDSREALINKRTSLSKLLTKLENHTKSWAVYLKNIPEEKRQEKIISFVKKMSDGKTN
jgi:hypothetical protein